MAQQYPLYKSGIFDTTCPVLAKIFAICKDLASKALQHDKTCHVRKNDSLATQKRLYTCQIVLNRDKLPLMLWVPDALFAHHVAP
jgi:hypothetical protein